MDGFEVADWLGRIASTFKSDVMPWSVQLELDCDHLVAAGETEGDNDLTIMARISRVAVQAAEVQQMLVDTGSAHGALHIPLLLASLDRIKRDLSDAQLNQRELCPIILQQSRSPTPPKITSAP